MTSGQFTTLPPSSIFVDRDARQRRELKNIDELAASIARVGLIHPPVVERSGKLRTGERRWTAIKQLGWTSMPVQYVDELDEAELQLLELEENLRREDVEWADQCRAVATYHSLRLTADPAWTVAKTGEALGMAYVSTSERLSIARELAKGNERLESAGKFSVARNIVSRIQSRAAATTAATIAELSGAPKKEVPLLNVDFNEWALTYDGPLFNFLHCDFPYGINADKTAQGSEVLEKGSYADGFEVYEQLLVTLNTAMLDGNLVAESAHIMFWFSMDYYQFTKVVLEEMGWHVNPFPLIWFKSDNTGILPDAQRGPRRIYETCFFASRGDRKLTANGAASNVVAWPGADKEIHMSEKPVGMLRHFMRMFVDEYSIVLDPTAGSANSLKCALGLGAHNVLGLERDSEFFARAVENFGE